MLLIFTAFWVSLADYCFYFSLLRKVSCMYFKSFLGNKLDNRCSSKLKNGWALKT